MGNKVKNDWLGSRVDGDTKEIVEDYIDRSPLIETQGQLIRQAVIEFIKNHPLPEDA